VGDDRLALRALVTGAFQAQCLRVAAELGLAGHLAAGPVTSAGLADACGAHEPALRRVLRTLVAMGVLDRDDSERYALTPLGEELDGLAAWVSYSTSDPVWSAWAALTHSVRTGEPAFDHVHGLRSWEYNAAHPQAGARFQAAMAANTEGVVAAVAAGFDFARFPVVVDVGGGDGTLLAEILRRNPRIRGVLVDLPAVVERARATFDAAGLADRCDCRGGDFRVSVPRGDAYLLKSVLHDWTDEQCRVILGRCAEAAGASGRLVIVERVLPDQVGRGDLEALLSDLNMLVMLGGRERTESEFDRLLTSAGFRLGRIFRTGSPFSIIEAVLANS
jgi:hypothetical protein